jgi:hypothetical protein
MERLIVFDNYNNLSWVVDCPFDNKETIENKEWFREKIAEIYREFSDGKITVDYEDELNNIETIKY